MSPTTGNARAWHTHAGHGFPLDTPDQSLAPVTSPAPGPNGSGAESVRRAAGGAPAPAAAPGSSGPGVPAGPRTRFRLGRLLRRLMALGVVLLTLWWLVVPFILPVTSQALVNARTVQVRAPIDGTDVELRHDIGDVVAAGEPLLRIASRQVDTSALAALQTRRAELEARQFRLEKDLEDLGRSAAAAREAKEQYQRAVRASLGLSLRETRARAESARLGYEAAHQRLERLVRLAGGQVATTNEVDDTRESMARSRKQMDQEQAALTRLEGELRAADQGMFLQKEASYFHQRADQLALKLAGVEGELRETSALRAALDVELVQQQQRVDRLERATAVAPVSGTVWNRMGNLGQVVKQNETVYEIADSSTIFVEALIHQRYLASVAPGTRATINVTGGPTLSGRVRAVRMPGPADNFPSFALSLPDHDLKQVHVLIDFDPGSQAGAALIGRHVRVLLSDERPGPFQRAVAWLFAHLRA